MFNVSWNLHKVSQLVDFFIGSWVEWSTAQSCELFFDPGFFPRRSMRSKSSPIPREGKPRGCGQNSRFWRFCPQMRILSLFPGGMANNSTLGHRAQESWGKGDYVCMTSSNLAPQKAPSEPDKLWRTGISEIPILRSKVLEAISERGNSWAHWGRDPAVIILLQDPVQ